MNEAASGESNKIILDMILGEIQNVKADVKGVDGKLDKVISTQSDHNTRLVRLEDARELLKDDKETESKSKRSWKDDIKWFATIAVAIVGVIIAFLTIYH